MTRDERSFIYGFSVAHCVEGIAIFLAGVGLGAYRVLYGRTTFSQVVGGVVGAFFLYMTVAMAVWLVRRRQGRRRIVVGAASVSAPRDMRWRSPTIEVSYRDITGVTKTAGKKGALRIAHGEGALVIPRQMLGTQAEFDELASLVQQRAKH